MASGGQWPKKPNLNSSHAIHTVKRVDTRKRAIKLSFLGLVTLLLVVVGFGAWLSYSITVPVGGSSQTQLVLITPGMSVDQISRTLAEKKLIRDAFAFRLYARTGPAHGQLKPGPYLLKPTMSTTEIIDYLAAGKIAARTITIPEGRTNAQLSATLGADSDFAGQDFTVSLTKDPATPRLLALLQAPIGTTNPEGLTLPDTYVVLKTDSLDTLATKALANFEKQALPVLTQTPATSKQPLNAYALKLTPYQRLIVASMIEKEASRTEDRQMIAGVFFNRLAAGLKLESDPTIGYVTGKAITSAKDLTIDSPYNTYKAKALPPTPIDNPSLDAMEAVMTATPNDYIYFIGGKDGKVHYAKTYAEHQQNIANYL